MNTKRVDFKMNTTHTGHTGNPMKELLPEQSLTGNSRGISSIVSKWVPLICAGAAVGVSIIALKEIKNMRKEMIILKKEQFTNSTNQSNSKGNVLDDKLLKKIELMDEQIRKITNYIASLPVPTTIPEKQFKKEPVGNNNRESNQESKVKNIINKEQNENTPEDSSEYEYEEVEVTDDEEEN